MAGAWLFLQQMAVVILNLNITIGCALAVLFLLRPLMRRLPAQPRASCWVDVCWMMPVFAGAASLLPALRWGLQGLLAPRVTGSGPVWLTLDTIAGGGGRPLALPGGLLVKAPGSTAVKVLTVVWLAGMLALVLLAVRRTFVLRRRKGMARRLDACGENPKNDPDYQWALDTSGMAGRERGMPAVWECEGIPASCVGSIGPLWNEFVILLQAGLPPEQRRLVLLHELLHIKLLHCSWKGIFWVVLAVYWYDPLVWLAYRLFCRDLETACDEAVLKATAKTDPALRESYAEALLDAAKGRHFWLAPTAFAETDAAARIKHILAYRPSRLGSLAGWAAVLLAAAFLLLPAPVRAANGDPEAAWGSAAINALAGRALQYWTKLDGPPETRPAAVYLSPMQNAAELGEEGIAGAALIGLEYPDGRRSAWQCLYLEEPGEWRPTLKREAPPESWAGWRELQQ